VEGALSVLVPQWQQRHLVYLFASVCCGSGVWAALAVVVEGGPQLWSLAPTMPVPRLLLRANLQSW